MVMATQIILSLEMLLYPKWQQSDQTRPAEEKCCKLNLRFRTANLNTVVDIQVLIK